MLTGMIFKIQEFALHDGPGIRTTVFLQGCPLRCSWCHNPEGLASAPVKLSGPRQRFVGKRYTSAEVVRIIIEHADFLRQAGGGVTFSGGEPLLQADFLQEVIAGLDKCLPVAVDTCGYATESVFRQVAALADLLLYDLKIMDEPLHKAFTGKSNQPILENFAVAAALHKDLTVRVPLIPGVTDTEDNLARMAEFLAPYQLQRPVELLPYNRAAGAKYNLLGLAYAPGFDDTVPVKANLKVFQQHNLAVIVR
jgi:pyruvate formate lyase activating enzyme